jgi:hypothetical protein
MNPEILLNDFAIRCYRDTADREYIHARSAYRLRLVPNFLWSSLHALEKYIKCVLLLNRVKAHKIKHEISKGIDLLNKNGPFEIHLSKSTVEFIKFLERGAEFRYFEVSLGNRSLDLLDLDRSVSEIRRYCQVLNHDIEVQGLKKNILKENLQRIEQNTPGQDGFLPLTGGLLEKTLKDKKNPAREMLVWSNLFFYERKRKTVRMPNYSEFANAPMSMYPEVIDEAEKYVYIPKRVVNAYKNS